MKFKLIGITPHGKCDKKFLKVLKAEQPYYFYQGYVINHNRIEFDQNPVPDFDLYKLKNGSSIEISAIVGKNGSGKSTLIELMYAIIYNIAFSSGLIPEYDEYEKLLTFESGVIASLYYQHNRNFYRVFCNGKEIELSIQEDHSSEFERIHSDNRPFNHFLDLFFYTIGVNYSHYSLNALHEHRWLRHVFHKNDGYQTPLVINPFRDNGEISINNEEYLTLARIATNLLTIQGPNGQLYNELAPGKYATHLRFKLNKQKGDFERIMDDTGIFIKDHKDKIIQILKEHYPTINVALSNTKKSKYIDIATNYLCIKLNNIIDRYKPYQKQQYKFIQKVRRLRDKSSTYTEYKFSERKLSKLLLQIKKHPTHITFKFSQAINFLAHIEFYNEIVDRLIPIADLSKKLNALAKKSNQELINVLPPSFFNIDIKFGNKGYLQTLSSGEKQKIYSTASWVYHLMNLTSVKEDASVGYVRYELINFVFDEIELYYHPDLQRTFIKDFIDVLNRIPLRHPISINCLFITHSPFILSDIPNTNILFLGKDGIPDNLSISSHTFAANIHELLKTSFFLDKGSMGAYSQDKIKSLMNFLDSNEDANNEWNQLSAEKFIHLIGEPLIQSSLWARYVKKFIDEESKIFLELEIARLQSKLQAKTP